MGEFEYHALKNMTDWFYLWLTILSLGILAGWPLLVLAPIVGLLGGILPVCGRFQVVPGTPIRVVRRE